MTEFDAIRLRQLHNIINLLYDKRYEFEHELAITAAPDKKFELRQRLKSDILLELRKNESEYAELLAARVEDEGIEAGQADAIVIEVEHAVDSLANNELVGKHEHLTQLLTDIRAKLDEPAAAAAAKLKIALPIIPLIASYEMELDLGSFMTKVWRKARSLLVTAEEPHQDAASRQPRSSAECDGLDLGRLGGL